MANRKERLSASPVPLILSIGCVLASSVIALLPVLKIISNSNPTTSLIGWLLTPVATFVLLGLDFSFQNSEKNSPNFISRPGFSTALKVLAGVSLVLLFPHVLRLAQIWSVVNN